MSTEESNSLWTEICTKGLDAEAKVEIEASLAFRKSTPREVYLSNITTGIDDVFKNGTDALDDYKDTFGVDLQELPAHKTKIRSLVDSGVRTDNQGEHPYASLGKKRNTTSNLFFEVVCILLAVAAKAAPAGATASDVAVIAAADLKATFEPPSKRRRLN